ncbi:N-acetylglucosamine kinase [Pseudomonas sp. NA-150]|uniref:N-acetylglucosamine kinase n=1 Tax=Pseudomonas sp. NA-150 TaxID=3367525 RepID=UPI0037C81FE3
MKPLILGLDSGGSKTLVAVADRHGQVLQLLAGSGLDPLANPQWQDSLEQLLSPLHPQLHDLQAAVLGLPLHGEIDRYSRLQQHVAQRLLPCPARVQNDVRIAFDGALVNRPGVLLLAGTGSMAWASLNGPDAEHIRIGGWGDIFGDEGSAYWIGREALGWVSRSIDGRAHCPGLTQATLAHLGLGADELLAWCYGLENRRAGLAALAELVSRLAEHGDPHATALLASAAVHLADHVSTAWRALGRSGLPTWSYAGGVFANRSLLTQVSHHLGCLPSPPRLPPVGGALLRAAQEAGWNPDDNWVDTLALSLANNSSGPDAPPPPFT